MENSELLFLIIAAAVFASFMGTLAYVSFAEDGSQ
jgi:hypothetical protein